MLQLDSNVAIASDQKSSQSDSQKELGALLSAMGSVRTPPIG